MIHRERLHRPGYVYPTEEWRLVEKRFYPRYLGQTETFFATANGYLGIRGVFEEGRPVHQNGTFVNGFYESWPITYAEAAYGFAKTGQTIVNVPDTKMITLYVDDEPFFLPTANLLSFERVLDMRAGTVDREILWETPAGKQVSIKSRRFVSYKHRHLAAMQYEVTLLNAEAPVVISSEIVNQENTQSHGGDPRKAKSFAGKILQAKERFEKDLRIGFGYGTESSGMTLGCGIDHVVETECAYEVKGQSTDDSGKVVFSVQARQGVPFRITKYMTYHSSRSADPRELCDRSERTLDRAVHQGFSSLLESQQSYLDDFWKDSDILIVGEPAVQQALRFNLFQVFQATVRTEGAGIPAKGLTGMGYEGHYFWDTEIYVLPYLIYTAPRIARNLLKFRHSMLDKARQRAAEVNQKGALFPWRTINGEEASAYYAAGTAQYHINADIMYALKKYVEVTGDEEFLWDEGAEMLVETARLWLDLGFFSDHKGGKFCIAGVTGPDEYNTVVNNNTFTNLMARENLWYAAATVKTLHDEHPRRFKVLVDRTGVDPTEAEAWKKAADLMYLPYHEEQGIHLQDDDFLERKPWDFANTPAEKYPLLLHYHPLVIYRHNVVKQADVILAMLLLGHEFTGEQKKRNFDYYDPLTTGDSSLSACIQGIMASEIGYLDKAREYTRYAILMDLADVAGNAADGCHIASMGGTWMMAVYGLAGLRDFGGRISFCPKPPRRFERIRFPLTIRGQRLTLDIGQDAVTYSLESGDGLTIWHIGQEVRLQPGAPVKIELTHEACLDAAKK